MADTTKTTLRDLIRSTGMLSTRAASDPVRALAIAAYSAGIARGRAEGLQAAQRVQRQQDERLARYSEDPRNEGERIASDAAREALAGNLRGACWVVETIRSLPAPVVGLDEEIEVDRG